MAKTCPKGHRVEVEWNNDQQRTMLWCSECREWYELDWKHEPVEKKGGE